MTKPRWIDANELTDGKCVFSSVVQFKHIDGELTAYVTVEDIIKVIENQPTAYDVDKVVEQLEELEKEHPYKVIGKPDTYSQYNEAWQDCLDRVESILKGFERQLKGGAE